MKTGRSKFRKFLSENFIMPRDIKAGIIDINLHRLARLEQLLFSFGLIMCLVTGIRYHFQIKGHLVEYLYYLAYVVSSIHVLILAIQTKRHPDWPIWRRNLPTYTAIFELLFLSTSLLFLSAHPLSSYTVYTNVCIISIVLVLVEPLFFIVSLLLFASVIVYKLNAAGEWGMGANIILTTVIMWALSVYRWHIQIKEFKFEKNRNNHLEAMEKEIQLAAFVQESFSKRKMPELDGYEIAYYSKAMAGVSGDIYDFYTQGKKLKGVGIFDVSGHGIASGLVTMLVRNIFQQEFLQHEKLKLYEVMEIIDSRVRKEKRSIENYLTGILLRMKGNSVEIVNAGHPCPVLYKKSNDQCSYFDEKRKFSSTVIGLSAIDPFFQETRFTMEKGDEIFLYTDGIKEALNSERTEYGNERFMTSVYNASHKNFSEQINAILSDIQRFTKDAEQSDDITIVIIRKK